jgi:hypothetical protein
MDACSRGDLVPGFYSYVFQVNPFLWNATTVLVWNLSSQNLHPLELNGTNHLWICWTEEAVVSSRLLEEESPVATLEHTGRSLLQSKRSNSPWPKFSDEFASVFIWMQYAVIQNPRLHLHGALSRSWGCNSPLWNNWCVKNWVGAVSLKQGSPWSRPRIVKFYFLLSREFHKVSWILESS